MGFTLSNSNYNGQIDQMVWPVFGVGNEIVEKGIAEVIDQIDEKGLELARIEATDDPLGAFVEGEISSDTVTTNKDRRTLLPTKSTVSERFYPHQYIPEWPLLKSTKDLTNSELNMKLMEAWMTINKRGMGFQISKNFFQGDTAGALPLNRCNGLIKSIEADGDVITVPNIGEVRADSFFDILGKIWQAIPAVEKENPNFRILMNHTDWEEIQLANITNTKDFRGVLGIQSPKEFINKRIEPLFSIPENTIIATIATNDRMSNLKLGYYFSEDQEAEIIGKMAPSSNQWFIRLDVMFGTQYVVGEKIVYYKGEGDYAGTQQG